MNPQRLDEWFDLWSEGRLSDDQAQALNSLLRDSVDARTRFREAAKLHGLLHVAANACAVDNATQQNMPPLLSVLTVPSAWAWRSVTGLLLGIVAGVLGVTAVWAAYASPPPVALASPVMALRNASFEQKLGQVEGGFPRDFGYWSGDDAVIVERPAAAEQQGANAVRFVNSMPDSHHPNARSIACDLFQLVDLQQVPSVKVSTHEALLELTASFLDDRPTNTKPSVTFFCQIYLFRGDPEGLYQRWPEAIGEAVSSGSAETTTLGASGWQEITVRALVPAHVDFAVVHLAARPNIRVPMPEGLFADDVKLVIKQQPILPTRTLKSLR